MTREIKFRYWHKKTKQFSTIESQGNAFKYYRENKDKYEINQFTGLKDKNGVEIYEGDTVETKENKGSVYYDDRYGCWAVDTSITDKPEKILTPNSEWDLYKVIGNIYQEEEQEEVCEKCGGDLGYINGEDETYDKCVDCGMINH